MHRNRLMAMVVLGVSVASSMLWAQQGMGKGPGSMAMFSEFDQNGDGIITQEEFEEARAKRMEERADDGRMMRNAGDAPTFEEIDLDGDGQVTKEEFRKHKQERYQNR